MAFFLNPLYLHSRKFSGETEPMGGRNLSPLPPDWDRINASENQGKAALLPTLPLITHLIKYTAIQLLLCNRSMKLSNVFLVFTNA